MRFTFQQMLACLMVFSGLFAPIVTHAQPADRVVIIVDASASMNEVLNDGTPKMKAAMQALQQTLSTLPPNVEATLRIYGGKLGQVPLQASPCAGSTRVLNYGEISQASLAPILYQLQPYGKTPISQSIVQAIDADLKPYPQSRWHIVLISDGAETCSVDPCKVSLDLVKAYPQLTMNVVGFGNLNSETIKGLNCIAMSTWGNFVGANSSAELSTALGSILRGIGTTYARLLPKGKNTLTPSRPSETDLAF